MKRRGFSAGFSLSETVIALGILASAGIALVGLLGAGIDTAGEALSETQTSMLIENIQAQLVLDPKWPGEQDSVLFDEGGTEVADIGRAAYRVELKTVPATFSSDYLESFRVSIRRLERDADIGVWMLQRARMSGGVPQKVAQR